MMQNKILYLFKNTRSVIKAQKALTQNKIPCLILPVPKNISSECGMCIESQIIDEKIIEKLLTEQKISFNKAKIGI
jgi:hypothetical protein